MGRIDTAECIGVSGQRSGNVLNIKALETATPVPQIWSIYISFISSPKETNSLKDMSNNFANSRIVCIFPEFSCRKEYQFSPSVTLQTTVVFICDFYSRIAIRKFCYFNIPVNSPFSL